MSSSGPSDNWVSPDGAFFYQIYGNASKLVGYATKPDGSLEEVTSVAIPYNSLQLLDLAGTGTLDVVGYSGPCPGFLERTSDGGWEPFRAFTQLPNLRWNDPNLRFLLDRPAVQRPHRWPRAVARDRHAESFGKAHECRVGDADQEERQEQVVELVPDQGRRRHRAA